jgi:hypothetical protein
MVCRVCGSESLDFSASSREAAGNHYYPPLVAVDPHRRLESSQI